MLNIHTSHSSAPLSLPHALCQIIPFYSESKWYHLSIHLPNRNCISFPPYGDRQSKLKSKKKGNNHSKWLTSEPFGVIISRKEVEEGREKQKESLSSWDRVIPSSASLLSIGKCPLVPDRNLHTALKPGQHSTHLPLATLGAAGATSTPERETKCCISMSRRYTLQNN